MKKTSVEVSAVIEMSYDENSEEFKEALKSYKESIDSLANKYDMLKQIAWYISSFGVESMIEGIGYISVDGVKKGEPDSWCGVDIDGELFNINGSPNYAVDVV